MPTVSNATPLIALSRIGRLDLLEDLFVEVLVPQAVYDELVIRGKGRPGSDAIAGAPWICSRTVVDTALVVRLQAQGLGLGEAEALALARETTSVCLTDDIAAILQAQKIGVPTRRTLGVILEAKTLGMVTSLRDLMDALRQNNFWIDDATYDRVLKLAGE